MKFQQTALPGLYLIEMDKHPDERGFFARTWDEQEFSAHGLDARFIQGSISYSKQKGTLRGLHYQVAPNEEIKLVCCLAGSIYDVAVDLRPDSPTFKQHVALELTDKNSRMLYVPKGVAHGFLTLAKDTIVSYQMDELFAPEAARGVRWNDPAFGIQWPGNVVVISPKDTRYPNFVS